MSPKQEAEERGLDSFPAKATLLQLWKRDALQLTSPFQKRAGLAPLREKTLLGRRRDHSSETRAGLPRRCHPSLAKTSRSNSFECQAAARLGEPPSPGGRASGGALLPVAERRGCWGVGQEPAGREGPVGEGTARMSLPVAEIWSGGARVRGWRAGRSVGSGAQNTKLN